MWSDADRLPIYTFVSVSLVSSLLKGAEGYTVSVEDMRRFSGGVEMVCGDWGYPP